MICKHIPESLGFSSGLDLPEELPTKLWQRRFLPWLTKQIKDFIGDTLPVWSVDPIVDFISN